MFKIGKVEPELETPMNKESLVEGRTTTGSDWTWKPEFGVDDAEIGGDKGDEGDPEAGKEGGGILVRNRAIDDTINLQVAHIHFVSVCSSE